MHFIKSLKSHLGLIFRTLTEFNRARVELAVHWLKKSVPTTFILNVFVFSVLAAVKFRAKIMRKIRQWTNAKLPEDLSALYDDELPKRVESKTPRVLIVAESSIPQCFCYRVQQKKDQLDRIGWYSEIVPWYDSAAVKQRVHFADIVIFYRVPGLPAPLSVIEYAQELNKVVIYDVDDLIFDRARIEEKFAAKPEQLSNKEFQNILDGTDLYKAAVEACSYAMTTTSTLQTELAELVKEKQCFVLPNALSNEVYEVMETPKALKQTDRINLLYGSGTRTHDEDFALVANVIIEMMQKYPNLHLVILGYLTLPASLDAFVDRIQRLPMLDFSSYLSCLRQADISIAPLESGVFADAKSEIKWLEAAAFNIPSVVSQTTTYDDVIEHGSTGFIAKSEEDWRKYLDQLISDKALRDKIGAQANQSILSRYGRQPMADLMQDILQNIQADAINKDNLIARKDKPVKIMFVNVLYAPTSVGGATIVVERIVNTLQQQYGDNFELSVVMSDVAGTMVNNVREYGWKGINVTGIGVSMEGDFELNHQSAKTKEIFTEIVEQQQPDIIHYHCIQRLTGSVVEVAREKEIPYVVTVHDGWWLSEYQFMLDKQNELIRPNQLNPLVAIESATNLPASIERTRYLANLLKGAQTIFAVSEYQADIYRNNGFENVMVNRNGLLPIADTARPEYKGDQLRIGYLGGVCEHKGYYFIKDIIEKSEFANLQFVMVDIFEERDYLKEEQWGASEIKHVGHYKVEQIAEFYANIDVLIAPSIWPESFGLVSREAALYGVWVIAADAGGMAEDVIEDKTGWVFPMRDAEALTGILQKLNIQASDYIKQRPDIAASRKQIMLLDQQVKQLVERYNELAD